MESRKKVSQPSAVNGSSSSSVSKQRNRKHGSSPCENDHCATCDAKFMIFRKKVRCELCRTMYCGACWKAGLQFCGINKTSAEVSKTTCKRCKVLSGPTYAWSELMELKSRELVQFLRSKYIDTSACVSKEELADLILQNCSTGTSTHDQIEHRRHVELMVIRFQQDMSSSSVRESDNTVNEAPVNPRECNTFTTSNTVSAATQLQTNHPVNSLTADSSQRSQASTNSSYNCTSHTDVADRPDSQSSSWRQRGTHERVLIEEIESESLLVELSSKQLKDILAYNFVDYRGVLERCELVDLARSLWRSRNVQQTDNAAPVENTPQPSVNEAASAVPSVSSRREINDRELCKICMEREIDCVLLECGHLVTCTECGRVLADCPICRRYVARVVHIFKT